MSAFALVVIAGLGSVAAAASLFWSARVRRAAGSDPLTPALVAGGLLAALLLAVDRGSILSWSFGAGAGTGRAPIPGVGVLFGAALLAALAGSLLLGAQQLAGDAGGARSVVRRDGVVDVAVAALWAGTLLAGIGIVVALARTALLPGGALAAAVAPLGGLAVITAALAVGLLDARRPVGPAEVAATHALRATRLAATLAALAALAAGVDGFWRQGTYGTPTALTGAAAALLGLAALEPTSLAGTRRAALLAALLLLLLP